LEYRYEFKSEPFAHQLKEFEEHRDDVARFLGWVPRTGKTKATIDKTCYLYEQGKVDGLFVLAPNGVQRSWVEDELGRHVPDRIMRKTRAAYYESPKANTLKHQEKIERVVKHKDFAVLTMSYDAFMTDRGKATAKEFLQRHRSNFVADECFVAGTMISTETGERPIESLRVGDSVLTSNGLRPISYVHVSKTQQTVQLFSKDKLLIECTADHPLFTDLGWEHAEKTQGLLLSTTGEALSDLRGAVCSEVEEGITEQRQILRSILLSEVENEYSGTQGQSVQAGDLRESQQGDDGQEQRSPTRQQGPATFGRNPRTDQRSTSGQGLCGSGEPWWERSWFDACTAGTVEHPGLGVGSRVSDQVGRKAAWLSHQLQARFGTSRTDDRNRSGRSESSGPCDQGEGHQEANQTGRTRVDCVQVQERRVPVTVYNLEVEGCPHYFANGYLVHNCWRAKSPPGRNIGKLSKTLVAAGPFAPYRTGLNGTPVANGPFDLYSQFKFLDADFWLKHHLDSYVEFKTHFGVWVKIKPKDGGREFPLLKGYKRLDYLNQIIQPIFSRVTEDDADINLPEKLYSKRYFEMTPEQDRIYQALRDEYMVEVDGELVTSVLPIVRLLRLQQIASGYLPSEIEEVHHVMPGRNPRVDTTMEVIEDRRHKGIVWCRFDMDIDLLKIEMTKKGIPFVQYDGRVSDEDRAAAKHRFQNDPEDVCWFLSKAQVGGSGLPLYAAKTAIYHTNTFRLIDRLQSEDRPQLIGKKHALEIIDIVGTGTVDERIIPALRSKFDVAGEINGDVIKGWI